MRASSELSLEGMRIEGARGRAILVERSARVRLTGNRIAGGSGLELRAVEDLLLARNELSGGAGIALLLGPLRGELRENEIRGAREVGVLLRRARQGKLIANRIHGGAAGVRLEVGDEEGPALRASEGNELLRNLIYGNRGDGIVLRRSGGGVLRGTRILHNLLHANRGAAILVEGTEATTIANNLLSANGGTIGGDGAAASAVTHNLFHANRGAAVGKAALHGDPRFRAPARGDFALQAGSPALDAGVLLGLPYAGRAPDLGPLEHAPR